VTQSVKEGKSENEHSKRMCGFITFKKFFIMINQYFTSIKFLNSLYIKK
jgi:hypothetical protein